MTPLFQVGCSRTLAKALGAKTVRRLNRPELSFPVLDMPETHHALLQTEEGYFAWLWLIDLRHPTIERM